MKSKRAGLLGLLVGDALGVPYEFHPPESIPPMEQIEMTPPAGFRRAHGTVPVGTWSDDGAQALCLLASLVECGGLDLEDFASRMVRWHREGYMAVDGFVFDIGIGTASALHRVEKGVAADESGGAGERENGNGSLMRVLPLVLWHEGTDAELVRDAMLQSLPTHRHPRSQVCCALYCLWARGVLEERAEPWSASIEFVEDYLAGDETQLGELQFNIRPREEYECRGSGYVVDCLRTAEVCVREGTYEEMVRKAIAYGHDTDTTACVAGGIAGMMHGEEGIPKRWLDELRGREILEPLLERL